MGVIVVGVDGSAGGRKALEWALEEARLRDARLRVVHAWTPVRLSAPVGLAPASVPTAEDVARLEEAAERLLGHEIAEVVGEDAGVPIEPTLVEDHAAPALVTAAADAELLVVGSRGHGGFAGLLLGSVSQQCALHAPCPVAIVREQRG